MATVLEFNDATVFRNGRPILDHVTWSVDEAERWAVLGPNGAGKSTLLSLASATQHPSTGQVDVLGERLGRTNVFDLRPRIGVASSAMARRIPGDERVIDVALTASYAVTGRWNEAYEDIDERRAQRVLEEWNLGDFAERDFGTLSDGEQKRTLIARAIMTDPELLLLDEPSASLDLGARENLLAALSSFAQSEFAPAIVMVTHHVEEIPVGITHVLLLREGKKVAAGPIAEVLTSSNLATTFGLPLHVTNADGRYAARASN